MSKKEWLSSAICVFLSLGIVAESAAQTDIRVTGPQAGFPVAVPQLCDAGSGAPFTLQIPELISKNLSISGLFKVLNPASFVETPGKCGAPDQVVFSDWSVIGAEGLVKGEVQQISGSRVSVKLYLYDVLQQKAVIGKSYEADAGDWSEVAHRFSNEIMKFFTGEYGIFGTRIAYVSKVGRFKEIFVMDLDGSNNRQLTTDRGLALSPSWSPDAQSLVYTSYRTRSPELYTMSPDGGAPRRVTDRPGLELGAKFMPDGSLVSSATFGGDSHLVIFDLRGSILRKLTSGDTIDVSPSLSPDGSQLAFCSNRSGGPQIYVMPVSGGTPRRISFTSSNYCTSPTWSPKGDKIAFVCRLGGFQLFLAAPDGGQQVQLTFAGTNEDPNWAPDGRSLVFSSNRNLFVLPLVSGGPRQVSYTRSEDSQPSWSPRLYSPDKRD